MIAPRHPRQAARLQALRSYDILDTDPDRAFDEIVQLASQLCGTPISVVNLIDSTRQWFKAETGLGVRETPIESSICAHAILEDDFVEIPDTLADPRMADNPLCQAEPGLRFYAGALLRTSEGLPLGTLCVLDYERRELTDLQRTTLKVLAHQVMAQLELRKALHSGEILRKEIDHRAKNSLQSLASFARFQKRTYTSPEAQEALSSVLVRVDAMSRLHQQLHQSDEQNEVRLDTYVRTVCSHLEGLAPPGVRLEVTTAPLHVGAQQAVAIGTFLNEFVTNSYKHAFPEGRAGTVSVTLAQEGADMARLVCADDGVGMGETDTPQGSGLGMKIAQVVCLELNCDLSLQSTSQGLTATLAFDALPASA